MNKFDTMSKDALSKMEELINASKLNELLHKKEEEDKKKNCILWVLAIIGAVAAVAGIAKARETAQYAGEADPYKHPEEDDDDDFDDDFFEEEEETPKKAVEKDDEKEA